PVRFFGNRCGSGVSGVVLAVAEDGVGVGAPAVEGVVADGAGGVVAAGCGLPVGVGSDAGGEPGVGGGVIAELSEFVVAPAVEVVVSADGAGVQAAAVDGFPGSVGLDRGGC